MSEEGRTGPDGGSGFVNRRMTRRMLLKAGAAGVAATTAAKTMLAGDAQARGEAPAPPTLRFLTEWEFDYVTAMAETIWPTDDLGPGASVAGVGYYIDGQLAGSWGQGHRLYLNGPFFQPADSGHGWQVPMTPADVYRAFLPGFDVYCKTTYGDAYPQLPKDKQALALGDLQSGKAVIQIGGSTAFTSASFFSMFRQNVIEGMLSDPAYGGNRDMVGWKWVGFPGDPMRRGDPYEKYVFTTKRYPFEDRPMPLQPAAAKSGVASGAGATGSKAPANAGSNASMGGSHSSMGGSHSSMGGM
ncbi:MAG TPA: gluconate 2-dehydrogenase subunit 3 family protein [Gaiellaceae bacterium]|nr:gluconate 2-dehydrogenase subunit 3 family protein [Gaiellaceae bacterium]